MVPEPLNLIRMMPAEESKVHAIKFSLNGQTTESAITSLKAFLVSVNLDTKHIAIAVNDAIIPTADWDSYQIQDGDHIEVVHAIVGG